MKIKLFEYTRRWETEDFEKLEAWDVDKIKMRTPQHSITKQE